MAAGACRHDAGLFKAHSAKPYLRIRRRRYGTKVEGSVPETRQAPVRKKLTGRNGTRLWGHRESGMVQELCLITVPMCGGAYCRRCWWAWDVMKRWVCFPDGRPAYPGAPRQGSAALGFMTHPRWGWGNPRVVMTSLHGFLTVRQDAWRQGQRSESWRQEYSAMKSSCSKVNAEDVSQQPRQETEVQPDAHGEIEE